MSADSKPASAIVASGATVRTVYLERQMKCFAVFDTEIEALSSLNAQAAIFLSVGSALLSYAVGIWINAGFAMELTPIAAAATRVVGPILGTLSVACYFVAAIAIRKRRATLADIRERSRGGDA